MQSVFRHFLNNLGSVILALLLAAAVWFAAILQADPFETRVLFPVPVSQVNQPENSIPFEPIAEQVSVEVRAPQSVLQELQISDLDATLDMSLVVPGVPVIVPIDVTSSDETVRIQAVDPEKQIVHLERVTAITIPVSLEVGGEVATGYEADPAKLSPEGVVVMGAEPYLTEVVSVTASVNIDGAREDVVSRVAVTPRDADGRLAGDVSWSPDRVEVVVPVTRKLGFKPDVEVVPDLQITPAPGYRLGSVAADPSLVTLKGPPSVLENMPGFVKTFPISITDATEDLLHHIPLTVPANVVVVDVNYVTVTIGVLPIQSSRTMTGLVEIQGVPPEWTATASPSEVDVIVEGPDTIVSELQTEDLQILLNLYDYSLGVHRVQPVVLAPEDVTVVSVIPETIEVAIEVPRQPMILTDTLPYIIPTPP